MLTRRNGKLMKSINALWERDRYLAGEAVVAHLRSAGGLFRTQG